MYARISHLHAREGVSALIIKYKREIMSYKQMKYFQDLEDYSAAYKIARADWEANPSLKWPKNAIAWLLMRIEEGLGDQAYYLGKDFKFLQK